MICYEKTYPADEVSTKADIISDPSHELIYNDAKQLIATVVEVEL